MQTWCHRASSRCVIFLNIKEELWGRHNSKADTKWAHNTCTGLFSCKCLSWNMHSCCVFCSASTVNHTCKHFNNMLYKLTYSNYKLLQFVNPVFISKLPCRDAPSWKHKKDSMQFYMIYKITKLTFCIGCFKVLVLTKLINIINTNFSRPYLSLSTHW